MDPRDRVLIVGAGYAGARLVEKLYKLGVPVMSTARSQRKLGHHQTLALDLDDDHDSAIPPHGVLIYLAPPAPQGDRDTRSDRLLALLERHGRPARSTVYVSTTGVYGDCGGRWIDESAAVQPGSPRAVRRVAAEASWRAAASAWQLPLAILRVAGIYGPGRLPLARLETGAPLLRVDLSPFTNRIHVDDLVMALHKSIGLDTTIDVADGQPMRLTAFYHALADAVGRERLEETADPARVPRLRNGFGESRRLRAERLGKLVGQLRHPDAISGIRASLGRALD